MANEEFIDKENESHFCLENNFVCEGELEESDSILKNEDDKGKQKQVMSSKNYHFLLVVFVFLTVFFSYADVFLQHLDTELSEDDVEKITTCSKTKTQIKVFRRHFDATHSMILYFNITLTHDATFIVAKTGNSSLYQSTGKVWSHWPTKEHKPPSFPQAH